MGDMTKNFSKHEFECQCLCGKDDVSLDLVEMLQTARQWLGKSMVINSGVRCIKHNKAVGGKPDSSHLSGMATDIQMFHIPRRIQYPDSNHIWVAKNDFTALWLYGALIVAGFQRFGFGKGFIHVDIDPAKTNHSMWVY